MVQDRKTHPNWQPIVTKRVQLSQLARLSETALVICTAEGLVQKWHIDSAFVKLPKLIPT
jgi:hypothetical protein